MLKLGQVQTLTAIKATDFGMYLAESSKSTNKEEQVLLPKRQIPSFLEVGKTVEVFLYKDSEDRCIATTTIPPLTLGKTAILPVKEVTSIGAFLDWGLSKDLLLPFKEQTKKVKEGDTILVALYLDKSHRLCATMQVYDYLRTDSPYQKGDTVTGIVYELSDNLGAFVAVDSCYSALIPKRELFLKLCVGEEVTGRVALVKEDGKLDLSIREKSYLQLEKDAENIYKKLKDAEGFLPFHDKTEASVIKKEFSLSKGAFKRAVGRLYKEGKIKIEEKGIRLNSK